MLLRSFLSGAAVLALALASPAVADTVYNFTLTSAQGYAGGNGSFSLNVAPPSTGTVAYGFAGGVPYSLGYQIDSFKEAYVPPPGGGSVTGFEYPQDLVYIQFTNGAPSLLSGFSFVGGTPSCAPELKIGSTAYSYTEVCFLYGGFPQYYSDTGTVNITPAAIAQTPEPSSIALLGTGLLGIVGAVRKRLT